MEKETPVWRDAPEGRVVREKPIPRYYMNAAMANMLEQRIVALEAENAQLRKSYSDQLKDAFTRHAAK